MMSSFFRLKIIDYILHDYYSMLPENIQMFANQMLGKFPFKRQVVPSRELTYPFPKALVKIMFLFPGGICLALRRVSFLFSLR